MAAAPRFWDALLTGVCSCVNHAVIYYNTA